MKRLLLTFFAVILCYSLFIDNDSKSAQVDNVDIVYEGASIPLVYNAATDSLFYSYILQPKPL